MYYIITRHKKYLNTLHKHLFEEKYFINNKLKIICAFSLLFFISLSLFLFFWKLIRLEIDCLNKILFGCNIYYMNKFYSKFYSSFRYSFIFS